MGINSKQKKPNGRAHAGKPKAAQRKNEHHRYASAPVRLQRAGASRKTAGMTAVSNSPHRNETECSALRICPYARECGGCSLLGVPYAEQLREKQQRVAALFEDDAPANCLLEPIADMDNPFAFRDKIASPFAPDRKALQRARSQQKKRSGRHTVPIAGIRCGLFAAGTHRIIPIDCCKVEHPAGRSIVNAVRSLCAKFGVEPYDEDRQIGFLRYVVIRVGHESSEILVTLVTAKNAFPGAKNFCHELVRRCPQITTIVQNVNPQVTNAILGTTERTLYGPGFILDTLCGLSFRISSRSFYQVNARQTEVLYRIAMGYAGLDEYEAPTVIDAYCGTGTIGLVAASTAPGAHVIGVDKVASAIDDARGNARHNGIGNAEFVAEDAGPFMRRLASDGQSVDVLFMDPPRAGSTPEFIQAVGELAPHRVVYISCNPDTQVRDVRQLQHLGYTLERMRPVDMFPHTDHMENVALLVRVRE